MQEEEKDAVGCPYKDLVQNDQAAILLNLSIIVIVLLKVCKETIT